MIIPLIITLAFIRKGIPVEQLKELYTNAESEFIDINGLSVHYRVEGTGSEYLVLIHGTSSSLHTWDGWVDVLKDDYTIVRMDIPGFGLTGPNPDGIYTVDSYTGFLNSFLEALDVDEFYLAGNSLGGWISWEYTIAYPDKVKKLILIDSAGYIRQPPGLLKLASIPVIRGITRYVTPRFVIEQSVEDVYGDDSKITQDTYDRYYDLFMRDGNRDALVDIFSRDIEDRHELIKNISQPTLIMWGEKDVWIPLEHAARFDEDIPDSRLITYPEAGHIPMEEVPDESANDARDFIEE